MYPLQLIGMHVTLREFQSDDLDRVMTVVGDDRVTDSLSSDNRSREQAEKMPSGILDRAQREPARNTIQR